MTVNELKVMLEDYASDGYGDLEVMVAHQPHYPLSAAIKTACRIDGTLWIATCDSSEYAPRAAWNGEDIDDEPEDGEV